MIHHETLARNTNIRTERDEEVVNTYTNQGDKAGLTGSRLGLNPSRALGESKERDSCVFCRVKGKR